MLYLKQSPDSKGEADLNFSSKSFLLLLVLCTEQIVSDEAFSYEHLLKIFVFNKEKMRTGGSNKEVNSTQIRRAKLCFYQFFILSSTTDWRGMGIVCDSLVQQKQYPMRLAHRTVCKVQLYQSFCCRPTFLEFCNLWYTMW